MENLSYLLLVFALVAVVTSQSYPRFEFRGDVLVNNSYIHRGYIGEGHNVSLHCVTDNSDCCRNGEGNWYDESSRDQLDTVIDCMSLEEMEWSISIVEQERKSGMWRCDISDSNGIQQSIYIYLGTSITGIWLCSLFYSAGNAHR